MGEARPSLALVTRGIVIVIVAPSDQTPISPIWTQWDKFKANAEDVEDASELLSTWRVTTHEDGRLTRQPFVGDPAPGVPREFRRFTCPQLNALR